MGKANLVIKSTQTLEVINENRSVKKAMRRKKGRLSAPMFKIGDFVKIKSGGKCIILKVLSRRKYEIGLYDGLLLIYQEDELMLSLKSTRKDSI